MINFKDRVVSTPNRYRVSKISEDLVELIPETGTITEEGTILNRSNMMAIQGLGNCETVFKDYQTQKPQVLIKDGAKYLTFDRFYSQNEQLEKYL